MIQHICWFLLCGPIPDSQKGYVSFFQVKTAELYAAAGYTVLTNYFDPGQIGGVEIPWGEYPDGPAEELWPFLREGQEVAALCLKGDPRHLRALDKLSQYCHERQVSLRTFYY